MEKFKFITHEYTDPYFNLASEQYLLKDKGGCYIYLWRNSPAVIVGVNQNSLEEVNLGFTEQNGIKVVRRLTGGGAVYHDLNNLCYTIIAPYDENVDAFRVFCAPVIEYLNSIGVKAEFTGRNDISVDGRKISGNAQTVYKDKIMHHGTLLFNTDTSVLEGALKPNKLKMQSKGIKSIRKHVANISEFTDMTIEEFKNGLSEFFKKDCECYEFTKSDMKAINELVKTKYSTYEWNIGYSPKGQNVFEQRFSFGTFTMNFDTVDGKMQNVKIFGDFFCLKDIDEFANSLNGTDFNKAKVQEKFKNIDKIIRGATQTEIIEKMF